MADGDFADVDAAGASLNGSRPVSAGAEPPTTGEAPAEDVPTEPATGLESQSGGGAAGSASKVDPDLLFDMLAAQERAKKGPARSAKKGLSRGQRLFTLVIFFMASALVVVEIVVTREDKATLSQGSAVPMAEGYLNTALSTVRHLGAGKSKFPGQVVVWGTLDQAGVAAGTTSAAPGQIGVSYGKGDTSLLLVSYPPGANLCVGLVVVLSNSPAFWPNEPETSSAGTYYFEAPTTGPNECLANSVTPPAGSQYVSTSGYPSARLP